MEVSRVKTNSKLIFSGGDERLDILDSGTNKYHVNPLEYEDLFHRGSCTCSTLNPLTSILLESEQELLDRDAALAKRAEHTRVLKQLLNYEGKDEFGIVFAPSGSDLAYLPSIFSKILYPNKGILLILTCPEELGSGSQLAYLGKYYATRNQFGELVEKGEDVNANYNVSLARFKARDDEGFILNHSKKIEEALENASGKSKIGGLVIGSKSGIEDDISLIPKLNEDVLWVVDLCQFRNSKKLVNHLLEMGCMVMITGSKFYMAPPFCGAMLVPKKLCKKINEAEIKKENLEGFDSIFSKHDFSDEFSNLRQHFTDRTNGGLLLRWEIALNEMNRFDQIPRVKTNALIKDWNELMSNEIGATSYLELMPHQNRTNQSIVSFRVKNALGDYLNYNELKAFYKEVTAKEYVLKGEYKKVFFGQPVKYGCGAFIRIAIGAYNVHDLLNQPESTRFDNDVRLIEILDEEADRFTQI